MSDAVIRLPARPRRVSRGRMSRAAIIVPVLVLAWLVAFLAVQLYSYAYAAGQAAAWNDARACLNYPATERPYQEACRGANGGNVYGRGQVGARLGQ